ncbi:MAG TPA: pilin [Candidatus Paceibacterota bacterium]|nr:pilin [Candidatus Paceibacterota bacterium]
MKALHKLFAFVAIAFYILSPATIVFAQGNGFLKTATSTSPTAVTCKLTLSALSITVGSSAKLSWTSTNATSGAIVGVGNVGPSGSTTVQPSQATTYIGSFTGTTGTANCSITLRVGSASNGSNSYSTQSGTTGSGGGTQSATLGSGGGTQNATVGSTNSSASTQTSSSGSGSNTSSSNTSSSNTGFLVPCGYGTFNPNDTSGTATDQNSTGCQACSLAQLVQNIINFLIGLSIPVAAALFAWAGVLYFTSAGDTSKHSKAKGIFTNTFIGFVIVITAWLVVNTLLHVIFQQGAFSGGSWFTIQCSANRPITGTIGGVLSSVLGTTGVTTLSPSASPSAGSANNSAYSCANGYALTNTDGLVSCVMTDSNGNYVDSQAPTCANNANPNIDGQCPDANGNIVLPTTTGGSATGASSSLINSVYAQETGSGAVGASVCNSYDACGPMQIQPGTACNTDSSIPGCNADGTVANQSQVENYLNTAGVAANQALAGQILTNNENSSYCNGSVTCALAEYNGGVKAVMQSTNCPGEQAYQCTLNAGYQQTRNYVASICSKTSCN